eukprot:scaffold10797_cov187-Amphora_coffeaeformis.AAC.3
MPCHCFQASSTVTMISRKCPPNWFARSSQLAVYIVTRPSQVLPILSLLLGILPSLRFLIKPVS